MAKAKQVAYVVISPSPLYYNGKFVQTGDIVTDYPADSIASDLALGWIAPSDAAPVPAETPVTPDESPTPDPSSVAPDGSEVTTEAQ